MRQEADALQALADELGADLEEWQAKASAAEEGEADALSRVHELEDELTRSGKQQSPPKPSG